MFDTFEDECPTIIRNDGKRLFSEAVSYRRGKFPTVKFSNSQNQG